MADDELAELELDEEELHEPLDLTGEERRLTTQPYDLSVRQLVNDVQNNKIVLSSIEYQREYVWDDAKASRLIESLLLNVPIPVCYFAESADGTWEVIDGLQRCRSIVRFLTEDTFTLRGLSVLTELNGRTFANLAARDQRRIENRTIRCVVISEDSHPDIKFDVFERLNTGAVKLMPQELRNSIYRGPLNERLKKLAEDPEFRATLGRDRDPRMRDEELVLRFLALYERFDSYKPPLAQFLNEYMRGQQDEPPNEASVSVFQETMGTIASIFEDGAYRMPQDGGLSRTINRALFDAVTVSVSHADRERLKSMADQVRAGHNELIHRENFAPLVGKATADRARMRGRVHAYTQMLVDLGIDTALVLPDRE